MVVLREMREWRTLALIVAVYSVWTFLLWNPLELAAGWLILLLTPLITLHSSLQHECLHGHPLTFQRWNDRLASLPLGLFVPYQRFKALHIRHHHDADLTEPSDDPESWYRSADQWLRMSSARQRVLHWNNTLTGRVTIGPLISLIGLLRHELPQQQLRPIWVRHLAGVVALLTAITLLTALPLWAYLISAYAGYALLAIRTFPEHQAADDVRARTVVIEDRGLLSWLFLNNNLHAVHHAYPDVAWYELPDLYRHNRSRFLTLNHQYWFSSYRAIWRQYAFSIKESVVYPPQRPILDKRGSEL